MSRTLYFGKINVNSGKIFDAYQDRKVIDKIMEKLSIKIDKSVKYVHEVVKKVNNETIIEKHKISFTGINRILVDNEVMIIGGVVKSSKVPINKVDEITGVKNTKTMESDEIINFCFYPLKEIVTFYCPLRFGYKMFIDVFQGLINNAYKEENFNVSLITNGLSFDDMKANLSKISKIKRLEIDIIPPNVNKTLFEEISANPEKRIESMKGAKITERSIILKSNHEDGLDINSKEIDEEITNATAIHSKISFEEAIKNGYVRFRATNDKGLEFNSNNNTAMKNKMSENILGDNAFANFAKKLIDRIF